MKTKITYALLLLLCCTLGASSNRNAAACEALSCCAGCAGLPLEKGSNTEAAEAETAIPAATGFLPGYSIIFRN